MDGDELLVDGEGEAALQRIGGRTLRNLRPLPHNGCVGAFHNGDIMQGFGVVK